MPAIQPARLRQQAALLAEQFGEPAVFVRSLHNLLDFYADRAHRAGQAGDAPPLLAAFNVRPPVFRQIVQELAPLAEASPEQALSLCEALWQQPYLEFRLLAAALLGQAPPSPSAQPILMKAQSWLATQPEERLVAALLDEGLRRVRRENPEGLIRLVKTWLAAPDTYSRQIGLRALLPMVKDPAFENLPVFFEMINPLARSVSSGLRPYVLDALEALAQRSPRETAFFLKQNLEMPDSPDAAWFIRQTLKSFPAEIQEGLRVAVRRV